MDDLDFSPVSGRRMPNEYRRTDLRDINIPLEEGVDRNIALLLSLHPNLSVEDTSDMTYGEKREYYNRLKIKLGIKL